jgi:hypothetical protein
MGKITIDVILKIVEVITSIAIVISDSINGRKKDDSTGSVKKK